MTYCDFIHLLEPVCACVRVSVMEALKKKHKEDLEREVERVRRLNNGAVCDSQTLRAQQQ